MAPAISHPRSSQDAYSSPAASPPPSQDRVGAAVAVMSTRAGVPRAERIAYHRQRVELRLGQRREPVVVAYVVEAIMDVLIERVPAVPEPMAMLMNGVSFGFCSAATSGAL